jgi:hypothetical protein
MRRVLSIALAALVVLGASRALAQQPESSASQAVHGVIWTFDPVHGTMQATPAVRVLHPGKLDPAVVGATAKAPKFYTGTIDITVTINLISALPTGAALRCSGTAEIALNYEITGTGTSGPDLIVLSQPSSSESVDATVAGSTATCKFTIPYDWAVPASTSTETITPEGITGAVGIAADQLDANGAVVRTYRSTTVELTGPTTVPQDGSTTTLTASTVL